MRITALFVGVMLCSALLLADDHSVNFDSRADFSAFKTCIMRNATVTSARPELNNPLLTSQVGEAVRAELKVRGLSELPVDADLIADWSVTTVDYSVGPMGRVYAVGPRRGGGSPADFQGVAFTEGTLVIDLTTRQPTALVWHGIYHDPKDSGAKLAQKLPGFVKKLLSEYPPKKKK